MHVLPTSNVEFSEGQVNHTFFGTFCLLFLKFALKQGQNFCADAPYRRVGFVIPKWHTRVQKSGKNPPGDYNHLSNINLDYVGTYLVTSHHPAFMAK